jgi:Flp pilus assembly protein protease CpaA
MNPFSWNHEHQVALLVAALIGAALAIVLGYIVYAVGWGEGALAFESWIWRLLHGPVWWALFGAIMGGASMFVLYLMRAPINSAQSSSPIVQSRRGAEGSPQDRPLHWLQERPQDRGSSPRSRS